MTFRCWLRTLRRRLAADWAALRRDLAADWAAFRRDPASLTNRRGIPMASKAAESRYEALRDMYAEIHEKYGTPDDIGAIALTDTPDNRAAIAARIRELAPLGRTDRWQDAIAAWAAAVEDTENTLQWAWAQYSVYASHAAE